VRSTGARLGVFLLVVAGAVAASPAAARVTKTQLDAVAAAPAPNAALPLDLSFTDENGRAVTLGSAIGDVPAVVVFADYNCRTLCGPIVEFTAAGLAKTGLVPGTAYHLAVIGLDPRDDLNTARAMRLSHIAAADPINQAALFLTGSDAAIHAATEAAGLRYDYDAEHDQYAHPAAVYVVDSHGRIDRVLSPLGLDGADLRLAIVDAGHGTVGTLGDRIHLLCYGYDPVKGIYTERITTLLALAAAATLVVMASGLGFMTVHAKRRAAP
jgi:protein SCO1/2